MVSLSNGSDCTLTITHPEFDSSIDIGSGGTIIQYTIYYQRIGIGSFPSYALGNATIGLGCILWIVHPSLLANFSADSSSSIYNVSIMPIFLFTLIDNESYSIINGISSPSATVAIRSQCFARTNDSSCILNLIHMICPTFYFINSLIYSMFIYIQSRRFNFRDL